VREGVHGWSEGGAEEGEAGEVGFGGDVHEADLEAVDFFGAVDKAELEAVEGFSIVDNADLSATKGFGVGPKADLEPVGVCRTGDKTNLKTAKFTGDEAKATDMEAVEISCPGAQGNIDAAEGAFRPRESVQTEARVIVGAGKQADIKTPSVFIARERKVEAEAVDGSMFVNELGAGSNIDADLEEGKFGSGSGGGAERRSEKGKEKSEKGAGGKVHGSRGSGQRLKS